MPPRTALTNCTHGYGHATIDGAHLIVVEECDGEIQITDLKGLLTGTDMELGEKHERRRTTDLRFQVGECSPWWYVSVSVSGGF